MLKMSDKLDIPFLMQRYIEFDKPIPFKENRLNIQPVLVDESFEFLQSVDILNIDKDTNGDIEIIQMPYLKFLYHLVGENDEYGIGLKLDTILKLSVQIAGHEFEDLFIKSEINELGKCFIVFSNNKDKSSAYDVKLNAREFDELRRIIMYQNIPNFSDKYVDPDLKKAFNDYWAFKNKSVGMPTFEKQISVIQSATGMNKREILCMTYRGFKILFDTCVDLIDYQINKSAEMGGKVEFKRPIEHWVYKSNKSMYAEAFQEVNAYKDSMKSVT
jgi:hypothetical protein